MKIYELKSDINFLAIDPENSSLGNLIRRARGNRMAETWGRAAFKSREGYAKKTPYGDCPYFTAAMLIVSDKLKEAIRGFTNDEIEFLPVDIDGQSGFSYMNVLPALDALDLAKTELKRFEDGQIKYVIQAFYLDSVISGHHIFRLSNYGGIYITEALKKHLEDNGVVGVTYRDTSERVENPFAELVDLANKKKEEKNAKRKEKAKPNFFH